MGKEFYLTAVLAGLALAGCSSSESPVASDPVDVVSPEESGEQTLSAESLDDTLESKPE